MDLSARLAVSPQREDNQEHLFENVSFLLPDGCHLCVSERQRTLARLELRPLLGLVALIELWKI